MGQYVGLIDVLDAPPFASNPLKTRSDETCKYTCKTCFAGISRYAIEHLDGFASSNAKMF